MRTDPEPHNLFCSLDTEGPIVARNSHGINRLDRVYLFQMEAGMMRIIAELAVGLTCLALDIRI
jgi:hypothetical protein